jgi:phosphoglucomutase
METKLNRRRSIRAHVSVRLREIVDLDTIRKTGIQVVFDPMWGSARG